MSAEQEVIDALHEHTNLCVGADTCVVRQLVAPLANEVDRLQAAIDRIACLDVPRTDAEGESIVGLVPAIERFARAVLDGDNPGGIAGGVLDGTYDTPAG